MTQFDEGWGNTVRHDGGIDRRHAGWGVKTKKRQATDQHR
jgi:hypothetical protein